MKMKQKTILLTTVLGLTVGLVSAIFVASMPVSTVYAQSTDPCSEEAGVIPSTWTGSVGEETRRICNESTSKGESPCTPMFQYLASSGNTDGIAAARDMRIACEDVTGGPCSQEVIPEDSGPTRTACFDALDQGEDPCQAIYDHVMETNEKDTAPDLRSSCRGATGSKPECEKDDPECCGGVRTSIIRGNMCNEEGEGGVIFGLLKWVLGIMTAGVGIAAVGGIGYGAFLYTTAENKPEQTKKAIGIITNVVIGIVAYALMYVFLNFLIPGGVFG